MVKKFMRFLADVAKVLSLLIAYLIVDSIEVTEKGDINRKKWTLDVLRFYNYMFLILVCFIMTVRMCGQQLRRCYVVFVPAVLAIAFFSSVGYVISGWPMCFSQSKDDYADPEQKSTLLEVAFWATYIFNLLILLHMIGIACYVLILMRALRHHMDELPTRERDAAE